MTARRRSAWIRAGLYDQIHGRTTRGRNDFTHTTVTTGHQMALVSW